MTSKALDAGVAPVPARLADTLWFNAIWFQSIWFCTVLGQDTLLPLTIALLALHVWLTGDYRSELRQLVLVGGIGIVADAALSMAGVYEFAGGVLLPLWLCGLWLAFSAALGRSLVWLGRRPVLVSLAGAIAFPLNYWAGQRLGAVEFGYSLPVTLLVVALTWGILLPLMFRLTARLARADGQVASQ